MFRQLKLSANDTENLQLARYGIVSAVENLITAVTQAAELWSCFWSPSTRSVKMALPFPTPEQAIDISRAPDASTMYPQARSALELRNIGGNALGGGIIVQKRSTDRAKT
jgi:hypothetical protein